MNTKYLVIIRQAKFKGKTQNVPSSLKHVLSGGDLSRADVRERVSVACPARSSLSHAPIEGGVQVLKIHSKIHYAQNYSRKCCYSLREVS